jgi:hypothetical protein
VLAKHGVNLGWRFPVVLEHRVERVDVVGLRKVLQRVPVPHHVRVLQQHAADLGEDDLPERVIPAELGGLGGDFPRTRPRTSNTTSRSADASAAMCSLVRREHEDVRQVEVPLFWPAHEADEERRLAPVDGHCHRGAVPVTSRPVPMPASRWVAASQPLERVGQCPSVVLPLSTNY